MFPEVFLRKFTSYTEMEFGRSEDSALRYIRGAITRFPLEFRSRPNLLDFMNMEIPCLRKMQPLPSALVVLDSLLLDSVRKEVFLKAQSLADEYRLADTTWSLRFYCGYLALSLAALQIDFILNCCSRLPPHRLRQVRSIFRNIESIFPEKCVSGHNGIDDFVFDELFPQAMPLIPPHQLHKIACLDEPLESYQIETIWSKVPTELHYYKTSPWHSSYSQAVKRTTSQARAAISRAISQAATVKPELQRVAKLEEDGPPLLRDRWAPITTKRTSVESKLESLETKRHLRRLHSELDEVGEAQSKAPRRISTDNFYFRTAEVHSAHKSPSPKSTRVESSPKRTVSRVLIGETPERCQNAGGGLRITPDFFESLRNSYDTRLI